MPYTLEKLLNVRQHRESRAMNDLVRRKAELSRRQTEKRQRERHLAEFSRRRIEREQQLFEGLQGEPAPLNDVLLFVDAVGALRREQAVKVRQVAEAAEQVAQAHREHRAARQHHAVACRQKTKIEEHKNVWMKHDRLKSERQAENEIEELGKSVPLSI